MAETVQRGIGGSQSILLVVLGREPDERGFRGACVRGGVQGWVLLLLFLLFRLVCGPAGTGFGVGGGMGGSVGAWGWFSNFFEGYGSAGSILELRGFQFGWSLPGGKKTTGRWWEGRGGQGKTWDDGERELFGLLARRPSACGGVSVPGDARSLLRQVLTISRLVSVVSAAGCARAVGRSWRCVGGAWRRGPWRALRLEGMA